MPDPINAAAIPGANLRPDMVEIAAEQMSSIGDSVGTQAATVVTTWQRLSGVYDAPEDTTLFGVMDPVKTHGETFDTNIAKVSSALKAYAAEVEPIKAELARIKLDAYTFLADIAGGVEKKSYSRAGVHTQTVEWHEDQDTVDANNALIARVNDQMELLWAAERKCANAIYDIVGFPHIAAATDANPNGYGVEEIPEGAETPWGAAVERTESCGEQAVGAVKGFVWDGVIVGGIWGTVEGLGTLVLGYNPQTGEWFSGDAYGAAWSNLGMLAVGLASTGLLTYPLSQMDNPVGAFMRRGQETLLNAGKGLIAYDQWATDPAAAAGTAVFNVASIIVPVGAATAPVRASASTAAAAIRTTARVLNYMDPASLAVQGVGSAARIALPAVGDALRALDFGTGGSRLDIEIPTLPRTDLTVDTPRTEVDVDVPVRAPESSVDVPVREPELVTVGGGHSGGGGSTVTIGGSSGSIDGIPGGGATDVPSGTGGGGSSSGTGGVDVTTGGSGGPGGNTVTGGSSGPGGSIGIDQPTGVGGGDLATTPGGGAANSIGTGGGTPVGPGVDVPGAGGVPGGGSGVPGGTGGGVDTPGGSGSGSDGGNPTGGGSGTPADGGTPWNPEMGDPTLSPADYGPDFVRDTGHRGDPLDPTYGEPRADGTHGQLSDWQVPPKLDDVPPEVRDLVTQPEAPFGKDETGRPYTQPEFEQRYTDANGDYIYPGNAGAVPGSRVDFSSVDEFTAHYGDVLDRMGGMRGDFMSFPGTPFEARGLPGSNLSSPYLTMRLTGDLPPDLRIEVSQTAPAFGREGGGLQVRVIEVSGDGSFVRALPIEELRRSRVLQIVDDASQPGFPTMSDAPSIHHSDRWGGDPFGDGDGSPLDESPEIGGAPETGADPDAQADSSGSAADASDPTPDDGPMTDEGGRRRPRNLLDVDAQETWAQEIYDEVLADPDIADTITTNVAQVERLSGAVGFTPEEIAQIRDHVMVEQHRIEDYDTGLVVERRFDPSPAGAAAWQRLLDGTFDDSDIVMLEHELAESQYMRAHPGATYQEAHRAANRLFNWERLLKDW